MANLKFSEKELACFVQSGSNPTRAKSLYIGALNNRGVL